MKHIIMAQAAALLLITGFLFAGSDGPMFPLANIAGVALFIAALLIARRLPIPDFSTPTAPPIRPILYILPDHAAADKFTKEHITHTGIDPGKPRPAPRR